MDTKNTKRKKIKRKRKKWGKKEKGEMSNVVWGRSDSINSGLVREIHVGHVIKHQKQIIERKPPNSFIPFWFLGNETGSR